MAGLRAGVMTVRGDRALIKVYLHRISDEMVVRDGSNPDRTYAVMEIDLDTLAEMVRGRRKWAPLHGTAGDPTPESAPVPDDEVGGVPESGDFWSGEDDAA